MEALIEAALAQAKYLRECALGDEERGARVVEADADRWEGLANAARAELLALRPTAS
jgi:hypothetical protein